MVTSYCPDPVKAKDGPVADGFVVFVQEHFVSVNKAFRVATHVPMPMLAYLALVTQTCHPPWPPGGVTAIEAPGKDGTPKMPTVTIMNTTRPAPAPATILPDRVAIFGRDLTMTRIPMMRNAIAIHPTIRSNGCPNTAI